MIHKHTEDGCDKGAHQSYLGAERNILINPNWFQPCQCCCCLCYPGDISRLDPSSVITAQVFEACDCLKLLSVHFDLCVDATGVVCHQLGLLGTDRHVAALSRRSTKFASSSSSPAKPSMSSAKQRLVIVLPPTLTVPP